MNRNFKRVLAGLAALTFCVGVVPHSMPSVVSNMAVVASAADLTDYTQIGDSDAYYKIDGDTLYVDGSVADTAIPTRAFFASSGGIELSNDVKNVILGENITSIGEWAFAFCKSIETIEMPNVTSIGGSAFYACTFKSIDMPNVTSIGSCAFDYCKALAEVSMPNVTSIGSYAFRDAAITSVDLSSVTYIGEAAFSIFDGTARTTCPNPNLVSVKFGETVPNGLKYARFSSSTKFLIPAEAYEAYQQYEEYGYTFFDEATGKAISNMEFGDYVRGIGFTLDGKIGVNLQTNENAEDFTVTCEGKTIPVIATENGISFYIAPKEMVKEYTIEVNDTSKTITPVDIVTLYTADDAKPELAEYADLAQSLADYCKAADAYFDGDETTKIELPADYEEWKTEYLEDYKDKVSDDGNIYKTSLVLNSETAFKIYVSNPEGITVDEVNADEGVKTQIDKNTVCVKISNLGPVKAVNNSFTVNGGTFTVVGYLLKAFTQTDDEELVKLCSLYADYLDNACYWED